MRGGPTIGCTQFTNNTQTKTREGKGRERLKSSVAASDPTTGKLKCFDRKGRSRLKGPSESSVMAAGGAAGVCLCLPSEELNGRLPDTQCVREKRERGISRDVRSFRCYVTCSIAVFAARRPLVTQCTLRRSAGGFVQGCVTCNNSFKQSFSLET